jgi:phosphatidylglycerophosphate synthase
VTVVGAPTSADFRARHRSSGLFTESVNQYLGSYLAVAAVRLRLPPTALTLLNLFLGVLTSIAVGLLAGALHDGRVPAVLLGLAALVVWQVAYSLDCADGQLARVTGQSSPAGARVDVLCDVAMQISLVGAVASVVHAYRPATPAWWYAVFAGTWMVNLVTSVLQQGNSAQSLVASGSPAVRVVKLVRDYGAVITGIALVIAFAPQWTIWVMVAFTLANGLFLLAAIAIAARASVAPQPAAPTRVARDPGWTARDEDRIVRERIDRERAVQDRVDPDRAGREV